MLFEDGSGFCPWHKADSSFQTVLSIPHATPSYYRVQSGPSSGAPPNDPIRTGLIIVRCVACQKSMILLETVAWVPSEEVDGEPTEQRWRTMVSPPESPRSLPESAPESVRSLYAEASTCEKAKAFRAAGVMYRAAVEQLATDQGAEGQGLKAKIKSLKGKLPDELVEDLHEARMLGDDSIHAGIAYAQAEVEDVAQLIDEAVLVLYVQPEQKRAMREARRARRSAAKS